jgi:hypothetical protein
MNKRTSLAHMPLSELERLCSCTEAALAGEESMCEACCVAGAINAGIPRSVIAGETSLRDHFSEEYINAQCNKKPTEGTDND